MAFPCCKTRCPPLPCVRLSRTPTTTGAPPHPAMSRQRACPPSGLAGRRGWADRMVPTFTTHRLTGEVPSCAPAASPRVRRSLSSWPPGQRSEPASGVALAGVRCSPTRVRQIWGRYNSCGALALVPLVHLPVSLAGPGSSGSADPSRRCQGCSHPPLRSQGQAALSFIGPLRRTGDGVLSSPSGDVAPRGAATPSCTPRTAPRGDAPAPGPGGPWAGAGTGRTERQASCEQVYGEVPTGTGLFWRQAEEVSWHAGATATLPFGVRPAISLVRLSHDPCQSRSLFSGAS
jgi:hypothetical protein